MSASFDQVNEALLTLSRQDNITESQKELITAVASIVSNWHDINHALKDQINLKTQSERRGRLSSALNSL